MPCVYWWLLCFSAVPQQQQVRCMGQRYKRRHTVQPFWHAAVTRTVSNAVENNMKSMSSPLW